MQQPNAVNTNDAPWPSPVVAWYGVAILCVNGEVWTDESSSKMHYKFAEMLAYASQDQTLYPGEVFGSVTPPGGSGIDVGKQLKEQGVIELDIEGIGVLRNPVGKKA
jgi:2-keto-4-pentenoate hydratase/2-oxohepta-3-ene-1,7-dioic acid hydratase in catechol pathway